MTWLLIWAASIIINTIIVLVFMKQERNEVSYGSLYSFFIFGVIIAPLFTMFVLIGGIIKLYNKILDADIMDKTIYRFK
jgi:hypothetical protein